MMKTHSPPGHSLPGHSLSGHSQRGHSLRRRSPAGGAPWRLALSLAMALGAAGLAGCGHEYTVPGDARRIHVGEGNLVTRARSDGLLWVKDETTGKVIWSGPVNRGDPVSLDSAKGTLTVGPGTTYLSDLNGGHEYAVYEKPKQAQ